MKRIRRLLEPKEGPRPAGAPAIGAAVLIVSLGVALFGWQSKPNTRPDAASSAAQAPPGQQTVIGKSHQREHAALARIPNPYENWLKEDVAYIIDDRERAAFKSLQTNEEREKFIEQFWERRDPTPGTLENEFKEEHYRRIAYANEHFASDFLPGWKTDRGMIYIVYGPPDEIETHPAGDAATGKPPYEQWRYRYLDAAGRRPFARRLGAGKNVIIEFDDPDGRGVYHMTLDPHRKQ